MRALVVLLALACASRVVHAYPQYQLSRDETCSSCHLSPSGGGLLSENGLVQAETLSQFGTAPAFLNGAVTLPRWLALGGDFRWAAGYTHPEPTTSGFDTFPMQADVDGVATAGALSLHVMAGARIPECDGPSAEAGVCANNYGTLAISREHYVMWQQRPGEATGLFVRAGRFMPVYGLRFVEHPAYDRQYGGTPLYAEAYGVAIEVIKPAWELHVTGFAHDPLQATTELGNGATIYGEARIDEKTSVGLESKLDITTDDRKEYFGATAKHYFESQRLLVQGEAQLVHDKIAAGGTQDGAVAYALGSYFLGAVMIDLGLGYYTDSVKISLLDQEAADLNIHWFATSHIELVAINRLQMFHFGAGGLTSGYSLLQLHYRL